MSFRRPLYVLSFLAMIYGVISVSANTQSMEVNAGASRLSIQMRREVSIARTIDNHEVACQRLHTGIKQIQTAPIQKLRDMAYLEDIIRGIGLTPATDATSAKQWYGDELSNALPGDLDQNQPTGLFQIPQQLACFLTKASHWNVQTMLETGTWSGWTSVVLAVYLGRFSPQGSVKLYTVDIVDRLTPCIKQAQAELGVHFYQHDSTKLDELHEIPKAIDLCFFDADHTAACVDGEMKSVGGRCKTKAFHDIVNFLVPQDYRQFWENLKASNRGQAEECTYQPSGAGPPSSILESDLEFAEYQLGFGGVRNQMMGFGIIKNSTSS